MDVGSCCLTAVLPELHGLDLSDDPKDYSIVQITFSGQKATAPILSYRLGKSQPHFNGTLLILMPAVGDWRTPFISTPLGQLWRLEL